MAGSKNTLTHAGATGRLYRVGVHRELLLFVASEDILELTAYIRRNAIRWVWTSSVYYSYHSTVHIRLSSRRCACGL